MSGVSIDGAAVAVVDAGGGAKAGGRSCADRRTGPPAAGWWRAWRDRFGLAEVCGTPPPWPVSQPGTPRPGSLLAAAALATIREAIGNHACIGVKTGAAARRATATWADGACWPPGRGMRREQLAVVRGRGERGRLPGPARLHGRRGLVATAAPGRGVARVRGGQGRRRRGRVRPGGLCAPGGVLVGRAARPGAGRPGAPAGRRRTWCSTRPAGPNDSGSWPRRCRGWRSTSEQGDPDRGCWPACTRPGAGSRPRPDRGPSRRKGGPDPGTVLYTDPVKPAADIARAWRAGVWRFAADSDAELYKSPDHAPDAAVLVGWSGHRRHGR